MIEEGEVCGSFSEVAVFFQDSSYAAKIDELLMMPIAEMWEKILVMLDHLSDGAESKRLKFAQEMLLAIRDRVEKSDLGRGDYCNFVVALVAEQHGKAHLDGENMQLGELLSLAEKYCLPGNYIDDVIQALTRVSIFSLKRHLKHCFLLFAPKINSIKSIPCCFKNTKPAL